MNVMNKKNLTSLSEFIDEEVGVSSTKKRDKFDSEHEAQAWCAYSASPAGKGIDAGANGSLFCWYIHK
jgi:hypothetical protein